MVRAPAPATQVRDENAKVWRLRTRLSLQGRGDDSDDVQIHFAMRYE